MAMYVKVSKEVAQYYGLDAIRNKTADGNYLLWQADTFKAPGATLEERVAYMGGAQLEPYKAKQEIDGTKQPATVTVPEMFQSKTETVVDNDTRE